MAGTQPSRSRGPDCVRQVKHRGCRAYAQRQPVSGKSPVPLLAYQLADTIEAGLGPTIRVGQPVGEGASGRIDGYDGRACDRKAYPKDRAPRLTRSHKVAAGLHDRLPYPLQVQFAPTGSGGEDVQGGAAFPSANPICSKEGSLDAARTDVEGEEKAFEWGVVSHGITATLSPSAPDIASAIASLARCRGKRAVTIDSTSIRPDSINRRATS